MSELSPQLFLDAHEKLLKAQRVLLVAHQKPDGDTTGAVLGLWHWLRSLGKDAQLFCLDPVPDQYRYLPGADQVESDLAIFSEQWEVVITCDAGDLTYAGIAEPVSQMSPQPFILNFDHHISNALFGSLNLVDTKASSTAEVVFGFFQANGIEVTQDMAVCLMTGVFTDTGGFSNAATNGRSLEIASEFVKKGASVKQIQDALLANKKLPAMKLWGKVLTRLRTNSDGFVHTYVLRKDFLELGVDDEAVEGLSNYLSHLRDVKAVLVLYEREDGHVKVSMRTYRDDVDLAKLAQSVGGGGHQKAAGFTVPGRIVEEQDRIKVIA